MKIIMIIIITSHYGLVNIILMTGEHDTTYSEDQTPDGELQTLITGEAVIK